MKLVRYGKAGAEKPGLIDSDGTIRDLSAHVKDFAGDALLPANIKKLAALDPKSLPAVAAGTRLGSCVPKPGNFIAVGLNFADHAAETNNPIPAEPILFNKAPNTIQGPDDDVIIPPGSLKTDWEVELAFVIGQPGYRISEADAAHHIAGYFVCNDVSERAYQMERGGTWDKGKGCDTFGPLGPWLVTKDAVPDPQALSMWLEVNGKRFQNGSTKTMIFGVAKIVSYVSQFMTLEPGDIITTGTPPGVGMGIKKDGQSAPVYLKRGDVMTLGIEGLGEQRQKVVAFKA
jgi:2-keto-4-pentenoate hydratase/2-oxohepta-3-ene-1,7-dioic acid hydratase in catechol pathway